MNPTDLNRAHWDAATEIHAQGNVYGLEDFKRGQCRLHRVEVEELGDVTGKSLLHLQCHFGLDTLSWARRGAFVTGVDFSPKAIALARAIADECKIDARFVQCDLFDLPKHLSGQFDIVYTSYGVLCWLPELKTWAQIIAHFLKPDGFFYIVEAHPLARVFPIDDDIKDGSKELRPYFPYFHKPEGTHWDASTDYADPSAQNPVAAHEWQHSMADIVNALIEAGLRIEYLHEFPFCAWKVIAFTEESEKSSVCQSYYGLPERFPQLPLMFSIRAMKP